MVGRPQRRRSRTTSTTARSATVNLDPCLANRIIDWLSFHARAELELNAGCGLPFKQFLLDHGLSYVRLADQQPLLGTEHHCFYNAMAFAMDTALTYVEGVAYLRGSPGEWDHAWCVDAEGRVHDPSWQHGVAYFGVPFATEYVRHRFRNQYKVRNGWVNSLLYSGDDEYALVLGTAKGWMATAR